MTVKKPGKGKTFSPAITRENRRKEGKTMTGKREKLYMINVYDCFGNLVDYFKTDNNRKHERHIMAKRFCACVYGYRYKIIRLA